MATNGAHRIGWSIYYCEDWDTTYETWYTDESNLLKLRKKPAQKMAVPETSILFQPVTVNIHYPKEKVWSEDIIQDLFGYSASEYKQGSLTVTTSWKHSVLNTIPALTDNNDTGKWNWE